MTVVGIHQPQYLPWLGLIERVSQCDIFIILDTVPYSKNYFYNRNKIRTKEGEVWLTIPVLTSGLTGQTFIETRINNTKNWGLKHWKTIEQSYRRAPFFDMYQGFFFETLNRRCDFLVDICLETFRFLLDSFAITSRVVRASELGAKGAKEDLLLDLCTKTGATRYLSGPDGRNYLNLDAWAANSIAVDFQNYQHPVYQQVYGGFVPNLSVVDLLFTHGREGAVHMKSGQPEYFQLKPGNRIIQEK